MSSRTIGLVLAILGSGACAADDPSGPDPTPALKTGVWYVHEVGGDPLPALVEEVVTGGATVRTYLDSATLVVAAHGRWLQTLHFRTWEDHEPVASFVDQDAGGWESTDSGYVFVSDVHGPRHRVKRPADSLVLTLRGEGGVAVPEATLRRQPAPPLITASWRVTHVLGKPMPAVMYVFDPDTLDGRAVSVHFMVDSATLVLHPTGRYEHRIRVTQWIGEVGGPPEVPTLRFFHGDFGEWSREGAAVAFVSHWLQNHTMTGTYGANGVLDMRHGFSHGDVPVDVRYGR